jgi:hypothetical protein
LRQRVYLGEHCIEEWDFDFGFVIPGSVNTWQTTIESAGEGAMLDPTQISGLGAFYTLVPIRPRSRCERRFLRTLPGASLRPSLAFNPRPRRLSTPLLMPLNSTPTFARMERPLVCIETSFLDGDVVFNKSVVRVYYEQYD